MIKFYDTSSLLCLHDDLKFDNFIISSITLKELENIKTAYSKDGAIKAAARKVLKLLNDNIGKYSIHVYQTNMLEPIEDKDLEVNNDTKILACAIDYEKNYCPDDMLFITNDMALFAISNLFFGEDSIYKIAPIETEEYLGYKDITMTEEEMQYFYSNINENIYDLNINQYLVVRAADGSVVDKRCWTGSEHRYLNYNNFNSDYFGQVRPKAGDLLQAFAADTLNNNQITMLKGPAGTGKSFLALAYLLNRLERRKIDKIIIFCNTVATKGSAKLGYLPGSRDEKLLDSQIGNFLSSKIGDKMMVERMIEDGKLVLLPMSDIRGYDTSGMRAGIYITEAQNLDINLMKLALQRIGEDSICVIEGDPKTQVDDELFAGKNNGMIRVSEIFRGEDIYGEITLKNIYRSRLAAIAEKM